MKLWRLKEIDGAAPWRGHYDVTTEIIVRAKTEEEARDLAQWEAQDEGKQAWLNPAYSTCEVIPLRGAFVLLADHMNG